MEKKQNYWVGKKANLEILKDNKKLFFTAEIIDCDDNSITFKDRDGAIFSFNRKFINQLTRLMDDPNAKKEN